MRRPSLAGLVAAAALLVPLAAARPAAATLAAGWTLLELPAPASSYAFAYVPASLGSGPAPAVVFLHGVGATPQHWRYLLAPLADELGFVLLLPKSGSDYGFGVGPDDAIIAETVRQAVAAGRVDPRRVGLAGHSAGGAYALELAYSTPTRFSGVFALASPYRTIVEVATPGAPPPLRLYYGTSDPNYRGSLPPLSQMLTRLGVDWELEVGEGHGHNDWPPTTLRDGLRFLLQQPVPACVADGHGLCLAGGRFRVSATYETRNGLAGSAQAVTLTPDTGYLWFFDDTNVEVVVKVLDACALNGRYWVFAGGLTNVRATLTVTDTATGATKTYGNPQGTPFQPVQDTGAFATCP